MQLLNLLVDFAVQLVSKVQQSHNVHDRLAARDLVRSSCLQRGHIDHRVVEG